MKKMEQQEKKANKKKMEQETTLFNVKTLQVFCLNMSFTDSVMLLALHPQ